jgi:hypothetical protein
MVSPANWAKYIRKGYMYYTNKRIEENGLSTHLGVWADQQRLYNTFCFSAFPMVKYRRNRIAEHCWYWQTILFTLVGWCGLDNNCTP